MSDASADRNRALVEALDKIQQKSAWTRPVFGGALLVAALSLIAATFLLVRSIRLANDLETANVSLARAVDQREQIARQFARASAILRNRNSSPDQVRAAQETSRELSLALPASSGGNFAIPAATPVDQVQLLTLGSTSGWDVDIFWCAGPTGARSYAAGRAAAAALASAAAALRPIAPGVRLGRIRIQPIQPGDMSTWRSSLVGRTQLVVTDGRPGEAEAARAVLALLPSPETGIVVDQTSLGNFPASPWYLSVIVCPAG